MEQKLSIHQLISKIDNPSLISAQLSMFSNWLQADDQYTMNILIPILMERLQECNNALSDASTFCKALTSIVESMADSSLTIMTITQGLNAQFIAGDPDNPLRKEVTGVMKACSAVDSDIRSIMIGFLDQNLEELSSYLTEKYVILTKLNEALSSKHFDSRWSLEKLRSVQSDIQKYSDSIIKKEFQPFASGLYGKYRQLSLEANNLHAKMLKKKSANPQFMSEHEFQQCLELDKIFDQLGKLIHEWINSVYQHEQLLLLLASRLKVYIVLSDTFLRAAGSTKDRHHPA